MKKKTPQKASGKLTSRKHQQRLLTRLYNTQDCLIDLQALYANREGEERNRKRIQRMLERITYFIDKLTHEP